MNWIDRILGATRGQLLSILRRSRSSINDMARALGITDNAVRMHLAAMQRDGMVRPAGVARGTGGKPAQLYDITRDAEELFPKAYALVLNELLGLLEERAGRQEVLSLLREVGARAAAGAGVAPDEEERVRAAAALLKGLGGDVEIEKTETGWMIRGFGCPLSAVVSEHDEACSLAESMLAEVTHLPVRECCDRADRPRCAFALGNTGAG